MTVLTTMSELIKRYGLAAVLFFSAVLLLAVPAHIVQVALSVGFIIAAVLNVFVNLREVNKAKEELIGDGQQ